MILALSLLPACSRQAGEKVSISSLDDLNGMRIGVITGTTFDMVAMEKFPDSETVYYNNVSDMPLALQTGKVDAIMLDEPVARVLVQKRPELKILPVQINEEDYAFCFTLEHRELCDSLSEQIIALKEEGVIEELDAKWFSPDESQKVMTPVQEGLDKVMKCGISPGMEPFTYISNGEVKGYDVELLQLADARLE